MPNDVMHKATLSGRITSVQMPRGSEVEYVTVQHDAATMWYRADPSQANETRYFQAFPTGATAIPRNAMYLGTCLFDGGHLVYHVFEVFPPLEKGV